MDNETFESVRNAALANNYRLTAAQSASGAGQILGVPFSEVEDFISDYGLDLGISEEKAAEILSRDYEPDTVIYFQ